MYGICAAPWCFLAECEVEWGPQVRVDASEASDGNLWCPYDVRGGEICVASTILRNDQLPSRSAVPKATITYHARIILCNLASASLISSLVRNLSTSTLKASFELITVRSSSFVFSYPFRISSFHLSLRQSLVYFPLFCLLSPSRSQTCIAASILSSKEYHPTASRSTAT